MTIGKLNLKISNIFILILIIGYLEKSVTNNGAIKYFVVDAIKQFQTKF